MLPLLASPTSTPTSISTNLEVMYVLFSRCYMTRRLLRGTRGDGTTYDIALWAQGSNCIDELARVLAPDISDAHYYSPINAYIQTAQQAGGPSESETKSYHGYSAPRRTQVIRASSPSHVHFFSCQGHGYLPDRTRDSHSCHGRYLDGIYHYWSLIETTPHLLDASRIQPSTQYTRNRFSSIR